MGKGHSKVKNPLATSCNWIRINLACELCMKEALLAILHDENHGRLPTDGEELYQRMVDFKEKHYGSLKMISKEQWERLCPSTGTVSCSENWDITLIYIVIQHETTVQPPKHRDKWKVHIPDLRDHTLGAWICRARKLRNDLKHGTVKEMADDGECKNAFVKMEEILQNLRYGNWTLFNYIRENNNLNTYRDKVFKILQDRIIEIHRESKSLASANTEKVQIVIKDLKTLSDTLFNEVQKIEATSKANRRSIEALQQSYSEFQETFRKQKGSHELLYILCKSVQSELDQTKKLVSQISRESRDREPAGTPVDPTPPQTPVEKKGRLVNRATLTLDKFISKGYVKTLANYYERLTPDNTEQISPTKKKQVTFFQFQSIPEGLENSSRRSSCTYIGFEDHSKSAPAFFEQTFETQEVKIGGSIYLEIIPHLIGERNSSKNSIVKSREWGKIRSDSSICRGDENHHLDNNQHPGPSKQSSSERGRKSSGSIVPHFPDVIINNGEEGSSNMFGAASSSKETANFSNSTQVHLEKPDVSTTSSQASQLDMSVLNKRIRELEHRINTISREDHLDTATSKSPLAKRGEKAFGLFVKLSPKKKRKQRFNRTLTDVSIDMLLIPAHRPIVAPFFKNDVATLRLIKQKVLDIEDLRRMANGNKRIRRDSVKEKFEMINSFDRLLRSLSKAFEDCTVTNLIGAMQKLHIGDKEIQTMRSIFTPQSPSSSEFEGSLSS